MTDAPRLNLRDWAAAAEDVADPAAWEYLARGSGANVTATENVAAWSRWVLLPHVLRDVSTVDLSTTVLGHSHRLADRRRADRDAPLLHRRRRARDGTCGR